MTRVRRASVRRRWTAGSAPICAYVTTTPWKSEALWTDELRKAGSSWMPKRAAAPDHWVLRCSVGATTVTVSTVPSASRS
jgi:hypothetical protein